MSENITLKVDVEKYEKVKEYYSPYFVEASGDYVDFVAKYEGVTITGFTSSKSKKSITFNGANAFFEVQKWDEFNEPILKKKQEDLHYVDYGEQIGSDEVGVGDFYLPMIVVAVYMNKNQYQRLKELGVTDSKVLSETKIKEIGPILMKEFEFSKLTLKNEKYNEMIEKGVNLNALKAKMHNRALSNLHQKYEDVIAIYVDEFVNEARYYSYLDMNDTPILYGISFKTKGEKRFPSVAAASVIARYSLLLERDRLSEKYGLEFPFGAGKKADEFKTALLNRVGRAEFDKLVKKNFKNYSK